MYPKETIPTTTNKWIFTEDWEIQKRHGNWLVSRILQYSTEQKKSENLYYNTPVGEIF